MLSAQRALSGAAESRACGAAAGAAAGAHPRLAGPLSTSGREQCSPAACARRGPAAPRRGRQLLAPLRVIVPAKADLAPAAGHHAGAPAPHHAAPPAHGALPTTDLLAGIVAPVQADMVQLTQNLQDVVGNRHPMLRAASEQIFGAGGKRLRPVIIFLVARATAELYGLR